MKTKVIAVFVAGVLFGSCSAESEDELNSTAAGCEFDLTGLTSVCNDKTCEYELSYTGVDGKEVTIDVDESTFDHYEALTFEFEDVCWRGPK